ncbi:3-oxoacyl-ACP synthase III family protein [Corallococcus llansteffanensis]|uniref:Ketoacyl-ACP synthase III n=1 Tax=Corallococcus llansteffanensis TaxID=2316731 RepID=A0A3A8N1G9_9BACT|nr:ketoacyl-ACP synthase III [Corallococcus llansteffanensis]RKH37389.1 ketoacyl-ACP synthase III [Corallococcus llansteffanensis]
MRYANILSTGRYVPEKLLTNADVEAILGEKVDEWLQQNVGIKQRHVMADDQATSDLAVAAAKEALARAKVDPKDLDLVLVASDTPDYLSPGTSSVVQAKLGAVNAGTYDINAACAGWVTALDVASKTISADDSYQRILVVGAYGMTRYVNWKDKKTCTLFADGAGAVVLGASDKPGFLGAKLLANGEYHDALGIYTGGTNRPATAETLKLTDGRPAVQFVRKFPSTFNTERWPILLDTLLKRADQTLDDVKLFVFTQLNLRTIEATMKALNQPMAKAHYTMDKWGYTGSACIPMTLDDAVLQGKVKKGDLVAFCASGGGLAMASALYRWTA